MERTEEVRRALRGRIHRIPPVTSKVIRIFISSTFSDTVNERNVLMEDAYPRLKDFCRTLGLEFQVVDMRWGVREEAQDDHLTSSLCIKEIMKCIRLSAGPSFVAMLGQKYGYRPFPAQIPSEEFKAILRMLVELGRDVSILEMWFKEDCNQSSCAYRLQPISSILCNYINTERPLLMEADRKTWWSTFASLQSLLRDGARLAHEKEILGFEEKEKYFISVTEEEIRYGLLMNPNDRQQMVIQRNITNLSDNMTSSVISTYTDVSLDGNVDEEAKMLLTKLNTVKIPTAFDKSKWQTYDVEWKGTEGIDSVLHRDYLFDFCDGFYDNMKKMIHACHKQNVDSNYQTCGLLTEVLQHANMCRSRCQLFLGRENILASIREYLKDVTKGNRPLLVTGVSGCGKTSVLAMAAQMASGKDLCVTVLRFLGTSPLSCNISNVLTSVCQQISVNYGLDVEEIPENYSNLVACFRRTIQVATAEKPLVIVLDSIDQLNRNFGAFSLNWIPWTLPPNVHMIISVLSTKQTVMKRFRSSIPSGNIIEIPSLGQDLGYDIVQLWLTKAGRQLTAKQNYVVKEALNRCSLPLYTKLVFEEVVRWPSYLSEDKVILPKCIKDIINMLFRKTEIQHGKTLVSHALSYITASRNGLSETELEDVLSLDDEVLDEVYTFWLPPTRRLPPLLWTRIQEDLQTYLVTRDANGVTVLSWYHRQFIEVAQDRYLEETSFKKRIHSMLSDYFLGSWAGKLKPFVFSDFLLKRFQYDSPKSQADRKVPSQPISWIGADGQIRYNFRKLSEMPFNLYHSGRLEEMWKETVFNYGWINAKVKSKTMPEMISDISLAKSADTDSKFGLLTSALKMACDTLQKFPSSVGPELIARLKNYTKSSADIEQLITAAEHEAFTECALLPLFQCFITPVEALVWSMEGHTRIVTDLVFSADSTTLFSISEDGHIGGWDVQSGERSLDLDITHFGVNKHAELLATPSALICELYTEKSPLLIIDPDDGVIRFTLGQRQHGFIHDTIVGNSVVIREGQVFNLVDGKLLHTIKSLTNQQEYVTVAITHDDKRVMVGTKEYVGYYSLDAEQLLLSIPCESIASKLLICRDDKVAAVGYTRSCLVQIVNIQEKSSCFGNVLYTFDYETYFPKQRFNQGEQYMQEVSEMILSPDGLQVAANMKYCYVFVFQFTTKSVVMLEKPFPDKHIKCIEFSCDSLYVVALSENSLCTWNAKTGHVVSAKELPGHLSSVTCAPTSHLVASVAKDNHDITVWDINRLEESEKSSVVIYKNPVDVLLVSSQKHLAFIKTYKRLDTCKGYHYIDHFGLDVWELSTFTHQTFLPFGQHGRMRFHDVSLDGSTMAICNENVAGFCVYNVDVETGSLVSTITISESVSAVILSPHADYTLVTIVSQGNRKQLRLYKTVTKELVHKVQEVDHGIFTSDSRYIIWSLRHTIFICSLNDLTVSKFTVMARISKLQALPQLHDLLVVTEKRNATHCHVSLYSLSAKRVTKSFKTVAPSGLLCFSKNGTYGVDGFLGVFNLRDGTLVCRCDDDLISQRRELSLIGLTDAGCHVIWADREPVHCLKAFHIKSRTTTAVVSTHSEVLTLCMVDAGYKVVAGCSDGHFLAFGLHSKRQSSADDLNEQETDRPLKWQMMRLASVNEDDIDALFISARNESGKLPLASKEIAELMTLNARQSVSIASGATRQSTLPSSSPKKKKNASSSLCIIL